MPAVAFSAKSIFLEEYPVKVFSEEKACPKLHFHIPENILVEEIDLRIFSGAKPLFSERFSPESRDFVKEACFSTEGLAYGQNKIEILSMANSLFFSLEKSDKQKPGIGPPLIGQINASPGKLSFEVKNFDTSLYKPIKIFVNGSFDHAVYPESQEQSFQEAIETGPGKNIVTISFNGKTLSKEFEQAQAPSIPFPLGIAVLVLGIFAFGSIIPKKGFVEKTALGMALAFALIITLVFFLNYLGILGFYSVAGIFTGLAVLVLFLCRKNLGQSFSRINPKKASPIIAIAIALFFLVPVAFHAFSFTDVTYWNKFYERQSALIVEANAIPVWDSLSYFGRSYSFAPGYFLLEAGISWISGLQAINLFAAMLCLANIFLFFALFHLAKALELTDKKAALFSLFAAMSGFLLSAMSYSPRHVFSFALFIVALAFILKSNRPAITGLLLAAMAFIQFPLLLFFPVFYLIIARKPHLKRMLKAF